MLINRMCYGDLICENEVLYVMECQFAGYALIVVNEVEKALFVNLLEMCVIGVNGCFYFGGNPEEIAEA